MRNPTVRLSLFFCLIWILILSTLFAQEIEKENIAVMRFGGWSGGRMDVYQNALTDKIATRIIQSHRFNVIDRQNLDKIMQEQGLQMTGAVDDETVVEFGRLAGVQKFIIGSFTENSTEYHEAKYNDEGKKTSDAYYTAKIAATIKMLDVETSQYIEATEASGSGRGSNPRSGYSKALDNVAENVVNAFFKYFAIQAFIESIEQSNVIIDRGNSLGVKRGMNFEVLDIYKDDLLEDRKADITSETRQIGMLRIVSAEQSNAKGRLIGDFSEVMEGHLIREVKEEVALEASILKKSFNEVVINLGRDVGLKKGTTFKVIEEGETVKDPVTGEMYGTEEKVRGIIHVNNVQDRFAKAKIIKGRYVIDKGMTLRETSSWRISNFTITTSYNLLPVESKVNTEIFTDSSVTNKYIDYNVPVFIDYTDKEDLESVSMLKFQLGGYNLVSNFGITLGIGILSLNDDLGCWMVDLGLEKHFGLIPEFLYLYPGIELGAGFASQKVEPPNNDNFISDLSDGNDDNVSSTQFVWNGKFGARISLSKLNFFTEINYMGMTFKNWKYKVKTGKMKENDEGEEKEEEKSLKLKSTLLPYPELKFGGPNIRLGITVAL